jgi:hypothetical protein
MSNKKQKLTYTLDNIIFKTCEKLERYKKLKEHSHFQVVIDENTVKCMCNKEILLYLARNVQILPQTDLEFVTIESYN